MTGLLNNRYRIVRELGRGGFGHTFLAEDTHMPSKRLCVIKQLKPAIDDPALYPVVRERFAREAAILEELGESHAQIPKLYAYFTEGEEFYLVQERIKGPTLAQKVVADGLFDERRARELLSSLLAVLEYVHSKKIIHRDIKPDNIILRDVDGLPVLIDFGAVKETFTTALDSGGQSFSIAIGSPGYMALEQAAGRPVYSSDLYSLAWTIIYLITGKHPRDIAGLDGDESGWLKRVPNVSPGLASILDKAIQPMSRDRFRTAREMLDALREDAVATAPTLRYEAPQQAPAPQQPPPVASPKTPPRGEQPRPFYQQEAQPRRTPPPPTVPFMQEQQQQQRAEIKESESLIEEHAPFIEREARLKVFSLYVLMRIAFGLFLTGSTYLLFVVLVESTATSVRRYWFFRVAQSLAWGAVLGLLQVVILRKYLKHDAWWIAVTSLVAIPVISVYLLFYFYLPPSENESVLVNVIYGSAAWVLTGVAQWLVLRAQVRGAWLWIFAALAASLLYDLAAWLFPFLQGQGIVGRVTSAIATGLLIGIAQGLCLLYFKRKDAWTRSATAL